MFVPMASDQELVEKLGGPSIVAGICGVKSPSAVTNWLARGNIPAEYHITLWRVANEKGIDWAPPGATGLRLASGEAA